MAINWICSTHLSATMAWCTALRMGVLDIAMSHGPCNSYPSQVWEPGAYAAGSLDWLELVDSFVLKNMLLLAAVGWNGGTMAHVPIQLRMKHTVEVFNFCVFFKTFHATIIRCWICTEFCFVGLKWLWRLFFIYQPETLYFCFNRWGDVGTLKPTGFGETEDGEIPLARRIVFQCCFFMLEEVLRTKSRWHPKNW